MVRSRFGAFGFWFLSVATAFFAALFVSVVAWRWGHLTLIRVRANNPQDAWKQVLVFLGGTLLFGGIFATYFTRLSIDTEARLIRYRKLFGGWRKFAFVELDGYVKVVEHGRGGDYLALYLVKGDRYCAKLSSFVLRNVPELEQGLSGLPFLGYRKLSWEERIDLLFQRG